VGESQDCNWAARGWVRSLFFVVFSYASKAALKIDRKSADEDGDGAGGTVWDMVLAGQKQLEQAASSRAQAILPILAIDSHWLRRGRLTLTFVHQMCLLTLFRTLVKTWTSLDPYKLYQPRKQYDVLSRTIHSLVMHLRLHCKGLPCRGTFCVHNAQNSIVLPECLP
jgi:hypothetical protein